VFPKATNVFIRSQIQVSQSVGQLFLTLYRAVRLALQVSGEGFVSLSLIEVTAFSGWIVPQFECISPNVK